METHQSPALSFQAAEQGITWVLSHPGMSDWLKDALRAARDRDREPIRVLNDVEILYLLLGHRSRALIDGSG